MTQCERDMRSDFIDLAADVRNGNGGDDDDSSGGDGGGDGQDHTARSRQTWQR